MSKVNIHRDIDDVFDDIIRLNNSLCRELQNICILFMLGGALLSWSSVALQICIIIFIYADIFLYITTGISTITAAAITGFAVRIAHKHFNDSGR